MVDFLVIGPVLNSTYKNMFHLIKDSDISFGWNIVLEFDGGFKFGNIRWFSNISDYCPPPFEFKRQYREEDFRKFDNYDAIYIKKSEDIPDEYYGVMGVPFVFLEKVNRNQFDIIGMLSDNYGDNVYVFNGEERYIDEGHKHFTGPVIDGRALYKRLLIRRRKNG